MFTAVHLLLLCIRRCCLTVGGKSNGLRFVQRWQRGPTADRASGWPWTGEWPGQFGVCGLICLGVTFYWTCSGFWKLGPPCPWRTVTLSLPNESSAAPAASRQHSGGSGGVRTWLSRHARPPSSPPPAHRPTCCSLPDLGRL